MQIFTQFYGNTGLYYLSHGYASVSFFYKMHIFGHKKHFFVNKFAHLTVFSYFCGLIITTDKSNTIIAYEKFILKVNLTRLNNQL